MRGNVPNACADDPEDFGTCFHAYEERFALIPRDDPEE